MPSFKKTQNSFSAGEISPDFFARNIPGAMSKLLNISVMSTGILARRPGTRRLDSLDDPDSIIITFGTEYLLVLSIGTLSVYKNGAFVQSFVLNWDIDDIHRIQWVQRFDTMIFAHPSGMPKVLEKNGESFSFSLFGFRKDSDNLPMMPFMRFPDTEDAMLTLFPNPGGTNWAKITASAPVWNANSVGGYMMFMGRKWQIYSVESPTVAIVGTANSFIMPAAPIKDWKEAAFSDRRGWPQSITFHQDRLVFGGSRDWPSGLWLSKTGDHHNFDAGTGLDDEAIFITLLSETEQQIRACVSSRDLLIMTDSGEWSISSSPLTPSNINVRQHTGIGTTSERFVPPQKINGNTAFISKKEIRELALDDLGENYNVNDLTLMARHIVDSPVSMAYSAELCQLFVVMRNGTMAVLTKQPMTEVSAWSVYKTKGAYKSVAAQGGGVYIACDRADGAYLEIFSDEAPNDSENCDFGWEAAGAPLLIESHSPKKIRVGHASVRAEGVRHLNVAGRDFYYPDSFSGDITASVLGTAGDSQKPLWRISSGEQAGAKILSVSIDGQYEI